MPADRLMVEREDRYDRQALITWWDQDRLANASVLVIGAGALGNELVKNLALIGVGTVVVVDMDVVENTNLSRCVLFREGDEGEPKAAVVAQRAAELNREIRAIPLIADAKLAVGPGLIAHFDAVLGGLDNREARLHINQACWKAGQPWVDGAIEGLMGVMRVFCPPDSACYECTMNEADHKLLAARKSCALLTRNEMLEGRVPTTATSASVIAAMQVQEAIKLLHRDSLHSDFAGRGFVFNGLTHDSYVVTYKRREDCLSHDCYDLAGAGSFERTRPLAELLRQAEGELGPDALLELEHELVRSMACGKCGVEESVNQPLETLATGDARCPECDGERQLALTHTLSADDDLLELDAKGIGLAPFDIVTARAGAERRHFVLDGKLDPFDCLESAGA
jgi:molybdopterin/thiamine biosynthesis adenylyltransferase